MPHLMSWLKPTAITMWLSTYRSFSIQLTSSSDWNNLSFQTGNIAYWLFVCSVQEGKSFYTLWWHMGQRTRKGKWLLNSTAWSTAETAFVMLELPVVYHWASYGFNFQWLLVFHFYSVTSNIHTSVDDVILLSIIVALSPTWLHKTTVVVGAVASRILAVLCLSSETRSLLFRHS